MFLNNGFCGSLKTALEQGKTLCRSYGERQSEQGGRTAEK